MKKLIVLLISLMFVFGMVISCDNGDPIDPADLKGYEGAFYGKGYDAIPGDDTLTGGQGGGGEGGGEEGGGEEWE